MAKPQLPAKAWLLEGYHDWCKENRYPGHGVNADIVTVVEDKDEYWDCRWEHYGTFIPKRFIEFMPPVCEHCNGTGYLNVGGYPHILPCLKCQT